MGRSFSMCAAPDAAAANPAEPQGELRYVGVFPPHVKTIAFISPGYYPEDVSHRRGIELVEKAGCKIRIMPHAFTVPKEGQRSAPLADRLADFYAAWNDPEVDMIICVRGGWGSRALLANLDWDRLERRPELIFQGFSDITLITSALLAKGYGHPVAGPNAGVMANLRAPFIAEMKAMHNGEAVGPYRLGALVPGDCSGLPLAGLLDRLCRIAEEGPRPDIEGRIVFIEDVRNTPEEIRAQLRTLLDRKFFDGAAGVVFCSFVQSGTPSEIDAVLAEFAPKAGVPVYCGFPFGHTPECATIDFGRKAIIENGELSFPAVTGD
ncbi:MAG: LD-carboxypeptidase [Lentisphaeria bacterium]|nr:LD-carboxypeptidase [Lentisphaeria bacterium]